MLGSFSCGQQSTFTCGVVGAQVSQPLVPLVDEFASRLFAELDYVAEGNNAERFQVTAAMPS